MSELNDELSQRGQIVLVFQGGGALGAYQAGVYEALHEAGIEPDWVVGTSIGAINAALIAGSAPDRSSVAWRPGRVPSKEDPYCDDREATDETSA